MTHKSSKDQALLVSVAESIGSTLGAMVAKADAAQRRITGRDAAVKRETKKAVRKSKRVVASAKRSVKRSKPARAAHRTVRKVAKRVRAKK